MYQTVLGFNILIIKTLVSMYLLRMSPLVNMYLTPWMVVLLMNSSQVTLSSDRLPGNKENLIVNMHQTVPGFYIQYLTVWMVVLLMNSSFVTLTIHSFKNEKCIE